MFNKLTNTIAAIGLASVVSGAAISAQASDSLDMAAFSCGDYVSLSTDDQSYIVFWIDGYLSHKTANLVIDFETIGFNINDLHDICRDRPADSVVDIVNEAYDS
ncbi:MAG: HdeA/HdeB family chaperone [Pseudomonadota bacterium]